MNNTETGQDAIVAGVSANQTVPVVGTETTKVVNDLLSERATIETDIKELVEFQSSKAFEKSPDLMKRSMINDHNNKLKRLNVINDELREHSPALFCANIHNSIINEATLKAITNGVTVEPGKEINVLITLSSDGTILAKTIEKRKKAARSNEENSVAPEEGVKHYTVHLNDGSKFDKTLTGERMTTAAATCREIIARKIIKAEQFVKSNSAERELKKFVGRSLIKEYTYVVVK